MKIEKYFRRWIHRKSSENTYGLTSEELEFLPPALELSEHPPSPIGRKIIWMLLLIFTALILWSCLGSVDEIAVATGKIIPSGYTKTIQSETTGTIQAIHVQEGTHVAEGEVLIELDATNAQADLLNLTQERGLLRLEMARLEAERSGRTFQPVKENGVTELDVATQVQLYEQRQMALASQLLMLEAGEQSEAESANAAEATAEKIRKQLVIASDKEQRMKELLEQHAVSDFAYQDYLDRQITLAGDLEAQQRELARHHASQAESMAKKQNAIDAYQADVVAQLVNDQAKLKTIEGELKKAEESVRRCVIRAPIAGTVQQLQVHTIGGVVTAAESLMAIVPDEDAIEMEVWVENHDIGFVHPGQEAAIKVGTFDFQKFGTIDAEVTDVSADAIERQGQGLAYRAVCKADQSSIEVMGKDVPLSPGMEVTAEIKTRKKRIIEFFMDPFIKYRSEGLRER